MNISYNNQQILTKEFRFAAENMKKTEDPFKQLYLFSATYTMTHRIFNIEYDRTLILLYNVLKNVYDTIYGRLQLITSSPDKSIVIPDIIIGNLISKIFTLAENIDKNDNYSLYQTLEEISELGYLTTGNGFYLFLKGKVEIKKEPQ